MKAVKRGVQSVLVAILILLAVMTGVMIYYDVLRTEETETAAAANETGTDEAEAAASGTEGEETETPETEAESGDSGTEEDSETEETEAADHVHTYTSLVLKPATCAQEGEAEYVCDRCDDSYREVIPMLEHTSGEWFTVREASVSQTGLRQRICSVCGRVLEEESIPVIVAETVPFSGDEADDGAWESEHEHRYTSEITKEATCTERGEETFTCIDCGGVFTKSIPATNHPSRRTICTEGDCKEPGAVETICNLCNAVISSEALYYEHTWGDWEKKDGKKTRKCEVCGETQTK